MISNSDTIAAIATANGRGGIGIVRISGSKTHEIAEKIIGFKPKPRYAHFASFKNQHNEVLDQGVALFFNAPHSFTGEDILELQGHGGQIILNMLLETVIAFGARLAEPGEFSLRAFLNGKIDLTQAEAIADLIDASSRQAAKAAVNSLQGYFSQKIANLRDLIIDLRMWIEAAIDFSDEEIDFLKQDKIFAKSEKILLLLDEILVQAHQGRILAEGMTIVILGKPNVGKSSLLNHLAQDNVAIVTDIPGTTRDIIRETIQIDGMPLKIIDTAGLRETQDPIEKAGIQRALEISHQADHLFIVTDNIKASQIDILNQFDEGLVTKFQNNITFIRNKIDLYNLEPHVYQEDERAELYVSVKENKGLDLLKCYLKKIIGFNDNNESHFIARKRHLVLLNKIKEYMLIASENLNKNCNFELIAEDLKQAQQFLNEITGEFSSDDLLGVIFSNFCIGK